MPAGCESGAACIKPRRSRNGKRGRNASAAYGGRIGLNGSIETSVGRYPLRLQVWHLAREYAIHADDVEAPMAPRERSAELRWRAAFGIFAAREEGEPVDARLTDGAVQLRQAGQVHELDLETFIAYLTNRPQQLKDASKRRLVRQLGAG